MPTAAVRIVNVRPKKVVALRGALPLKCDRKDQFIRNVSQSFDSYVRRYGYEPDAVVTVLCGVKQNAEAFWVVRGDSEGGGTSILALAASALNREIAS